jgi:hypothetical protein
MLVVAFLYSAHKLYTYRCVCLPSSHALTDLPTHLIACGLTAVTDKQRAA